MTKLHLARLKWSVLAALLPFLVFGHSPSLARDKITFVSTHIPPFSIKGGKRPGFVREIAGELGRRLGIVMKVRYAETPRAAIEVVKSRPNTLIFPLARTKQREPHFLWLLKVRDVPLFFAAAPGKPTIVTIAQARAASAIGVRQGFAVRDLTNRGFTNLIAVRTPEENARALAAGRITAWYAPGPEILYTWRTTGQKGQVGRGLTTRTVRSYIAASKLSPLVDVARWRATFAAMQREGVVDKIVENYLGR